jgi:hypothetical protein
MCLNCLAGFPLPMIKQSFLASIKRLIILKGNYSLSGKWVLPSIFPAIRIKMHLNWKEGLSAGNYPPQETGLTYNSWYGKPHLEMHWWHAIHFALWGRIELLEKSLSWYSKVYEEARKIAQRQGYEGVRWQKMTDHDGKESPSSVGSFLIWQQPHIIYFSELAYREHRDVQTLEKYKDLVFATADFMASYAHYDPITNKYILGKGVIPAQERFKAEETFNPTYELVYWHWALTIAQQWRERLHLPRNKKWDDVLKRLSPLPVQGDKYLFTESGTDSYTNYEYSGDHPSVLGALGMLPNTPMMDTAIMHHTFNWIWNNWRWKDTWGWDYPGRQAYHLFARQWWVTGSCGNDVCRL